METSHLPHSVYTAWPQVPGLLRGPLASGMSTLLEQSKGWEASALLEFPDKGWGQPAHS